MISHSHQYIQLCVVYCSRGHAYTVEFHHLKSPHYSPYWHQLLLIDKHPTLSVAGCLLAYARHYRAVTYLMRSDRICANWHYHQMLFFQHCFQLERIQFYGLVMAVQKRFNLLAFITTGGFNKCWSLMVKVCSGWFWSIGKFSGIWLGPIAFAVATVPSNLKFITILAGPSACSCETSPGPTVCLRIVPFAATDKYMESPVDCCCRTLLSSLISILNFSKSASIGWIPNCVVIVLVRGLRRSIVSCLTVSEDRSTTPVVMLVLRDLKNSLEIFCLFLKLKFITSCKQNAVVVSVPYVFLLVYHTINGKLHKCDQIAFHAQTRQSCQPLSLEFEAYDWQQWCLNFSCP